MDFWEWLLLTLINGLLLLNKSRSNQALHLLLCTLQQLSPTNLAFILILWKENISLGFWFTHNPISKSFSVVFVWSNTQYIGARRFDLFYWIKKLAKEKSNLFLYTFPFEETSFFPSFLFPAIGTYIIGLVGFAQSIIYSVAKD